MRVALDTNILVYAEGLGDERRVNCTRRILAEIPQECIVLPVQTLGERYRVLVELAAQPEHDIDFSDVSATTAPDWQGARRGPFYRPVKKQLTVRIDADVLEWLKSQGKGYQRRLNAILRSAMLDQQS